MGISQGAFPPERLGSKGWMGDFLESELVRPAIQKDATIVFITDGPLPLFRFG